MALPQDVTTQDREQSGTLATTLVRVAIYLPRVMVDVLTTSPASAVVNVAVGSNASKQTGDAAVSGRVLPAGTYDVEYRHPAPGSGYPWFLLMSGNTATVQLTGSP